MSRKIFHHPNLLSLIVLSFFGISFFVIVAFSPPAYYEYSLFRKPIVGLIFGLICISGSIAVLSSKECSRILHFRKEKDVSDKRYKYQKNLIVPNTSLILGLKIVHGHHPDCEKFSAHEFRIRNKTFCTGCTGLLFGALISLLGTLIYFSRNFLVPPFPIGVGLLGVALGLLLPLLNLQQNILRVFLNAFFVFGIFLALIGIDSIMQNLFIDILLISLSIFWLFTRISLSQWNHQRICHGCEYKCKLETV